MMMRIWRATEGIRYFMVLWLVCTIGFVYLVGCGGGSSANVEEAEISYQEWEEEEAEEGYYYGREAARKANELCEEDIGVQEVIMSQEGEGLELVVCEGGEVHAP